MNDGASMPDPPSVRYPTRIDKLLAGQPKLRKRFEQLAADPGVSGDALLAQMRTAGIDAKRGSVFNGMRPFRLVDRARPHGLASRVAAAVFELGRGRLYKLAAELGIQ